MERKKMSRKLVMSVLLTALVAVNPFKSMAQTLSYNLPELYNDNGDNFTVIAHRGASAYYPENTMAAFRAAVEMDAEMIELDVLLSKDGVPVVIHDETLDRTTDGEGSVSDYTLEELKRLDAGSWFGEKFRGEPIPTLEEVLEYAAGTIALNIEIKTEAVTDNAKGGVEEESIRLVRKYGMEDHVLFSSFDYRAISHLKELAPDIPAALLYNNNESPNRTPSELVEAYKADAFNCSFSQLNNRRLKNIREHNIPVFVYTVNNRGRMKKLINKGVTGIFSDKPDLLLEAARNLL